MTFTRLTFSIAFLALLGAANAAGTLYNADFEMIPILGDGQTAPGDGEIKLTETDPSNTEWYPIAVSGIQYWAYSFDPESGTGTDIGLGYHLGLGDGNDSQVLNINRWDRRVGQTVEGLAIQAGYRYTASVRCYLPLDPEAPFKVGTFSLYAGTLGDPDGFTLLNELGYANAISEAALPEFGGEHSFLMNEQGWVELSVSYMALAGDVNIGQSFTLSMMTRGGSGGATYWDNVTLTAEAVPEPFTLSLGIGALALVLRKRRR